MSRDSLYLDLARSLARAVHRDQLRKGGEPYFNHVQRVAIKAGNKAGTRAATIAYLHDTVEDTSIVPTTLVRLGFDEGIVLDVGALSRREHETYKAFVSRTIRTGSVDALIVKLADLDDNMHDPAKVIKGDRYQKADAAIRAELVRRGVTPPSFVRGS